MFIIMVIKLKPILQALTGPWCNEDINLSYCSIIFHKFLIKYNNIMYVNEEQKCSNSVKASLKSYLYITKLSVAETRIPSSL